MLPGRRAPIATLRRPVRGGASRPAGGVSVTIAEGVRTSARRTPAATALCEGARELDYRSLVQRANRVSNGAMGSGLAPGDRSAVLSGNRLEFVELVLGLAEAGIPPAMINPRSTPEEIAFLCADSGARMLFVDRSLEEVARDADLPDVERIVVLGGDYERWLADARPDPPATTPGEGDVFCIPYTAGTTGAPKGVLLTHRSRTLTFLAMAAEYGCYGPDDRALALAPLYHGAGFAFAMAPLFLGGSCTIMPRFEPELALRAIDEGRSTSTFMTPTHFSSLFALEPRPLDRYHTGSLTALVSNAAPLSQAMKERIVERFGPDVLFEAYGSTEASIVSNLRPADQLRKQQCVGLPFPMTSVRIQAPDGSEAGAGEIGELFSRSPYLFAGYWGRPEEGAAALRDGWFSAGDLARRDEEGYLYIVDRVDDRIISGGVNIYPREIEETLLRHPAVADAAVFGVPDEHWGEAVQAAVQLRADGAATADELLDFCRRGLAGHKRPKRLRLVGELPRNSAGKILRRSLRERFSGAAEPA